MHTLRIVTVNSLAQVVGKIITAGAAILILALLARSLGPDGFGGFTLMTTYAAMFYMVADFGFNAIVLRDAAGDQTKIKAGFTKLLGLRTIYSLVLVFIALSILSFFPYEPTVKLATIVTILTIITQAIYSTANLVFQFKLRYDLSVVVAAVGSLLNLGIVFVLAQGQVNLVAVALSYVAAGVAMAVVALALVRTLIGSFQPSFAVSDWFRLTLVTLPVGLTLIFNLIYFRADTFILSFVKTSGDVGIYGAAYKIFEVVLVLPTFFMNALYPVLIRLFEQDRAKFRQSVRYAILGLAGLGLAGAAAGIFLAPWGVNLLYGGKFADSVLPLQLLLASVPIFFLSNLYMWLMLILKRQKTMALVYAFGMVINVALNLYFIPQYSYLAAAIITGVSEALILVLTYYLSRDWKNEDHSAQ